MSPLNKLVKGDIFIMGSIFKAAHRSIEYVNACYASGKSSFKSCA